VGLLGLWVAETVPLFGLIGAGLRSIFCFRGGIFGIWWEGVGEEVVGKEDWKRKGGDERMGRSAIDLGKVK
jgi:hypothetical protein